MQQTYMMVDPRQIELDMPISSENVAVKQASIADKGIVQPVALWIQNMRLIDGFHRVAAACLLGMTEIPAIVIDCDEEAFWDARIQSAKQHHDVEHDRAAVWMFQSWKASSLATGPEVIDFLRFIYGVALQMPGVMPYGQKPPALTEEATQWYERKKERWGANLDDAMLCLLRRNNASPEGWANVINGEVSFEHAQILNANFGRLLDRRDERRFDDENLTIADVEQFATVERPRIIALQAAKPEKHFAYPGMVWLEERKAERRNKEWEARRAQLDAESQFSKTPEGKAQGRIANIRHATAQLEVARSYLHKLVEWRYQDVTLEEVIAESPKGREAATRLVEAFASIQKMMGRHVEHNGLLEQNKALRDENWTLQARIKRVEAEADALRRKRANQALAMSSTDIEHLPA